MREIKFRAWDKCAEFMLYSDKHTDDYFFEFYAGKIGAYGITLGASTIYEPPQPETYELSEIMQYTGLKDRNGKEIYESDIVFIDNDKFEVIWNKKRARYALKSCFDGKLYTYLWGGEFGSIEIIGNIYENKELLEVIRRSIHRKKGQNAE